MFMIYNSITHPLSLQSQLFSIFCCFYLMFFYLWGCLSEKIWVEEKERLISYFWQPIFVVLGSNQNPFISMLKKVIKPSPLVKQQPQTLQYFTENFIQKVAKTAQYVKCATKTISQTKLQSNTFVDFVLSVNKHLSFLLLGQALKG